MTAAAMAEIREATAADTATVVALLRALAETLGEGEKFRSTEATIRRYGFGADRRLWPLLAFEGQQPVGLATYIPTFSTIRGAPGVYLQDLYVTPAARRRGLGEQLIKAVIRGAEAEWGAAYLTLLVYDQNGSARRFYRRLGCRLPDDERPAFIDGPAFTALGEGA